MKNRLPAFTFRAVVIGVVAMFVLGWWVQYHEVISGFHLLVENFPPSGAVGVFLVVLAVAALVHAVGKRLRLGRGELIVIYTMLLIAAPLMTQGMWRRFLGLVVSVPRNHMVLVDHYSEKLWPHGEHLLENRRFEQGFTEGMTPASHERIQIISVDDSKVGPTKAVELHNPKPSDEAEEKQSLSFQIRLPRYGPDGAERLVPNENYYITALFRLTDMPTTSRFDVEVVSDSGERVSVISLNRSTKDLFSSPGGFVRNGAVYVVLPRSTTEYADLVFTLNGPGKAAVTDIVVFSNEAMHRMHKGSTEITTSQLARLDVIDTQRQQREHLLERPDSIASPGGIWYTLKGYIPWDQWATPLFYWSTIVMAMFVCLLGMGVIFRKQWSENERFSFPMVVLPRMLIAEEERDGVIVRPLYQKKSFRAGVLVALLYSILQGLAFYIPGMPDPTVDVNMADYFSNPATKAYLNGFYGEGARFKFGLMLMAIAFFVDLDMLLTILVSYYICKLPFFFGEYYGWKTIKGPADPFPFWFEQHIGSFLMLALVVLYTSRKHLAGVWKRILGRPGGVDDSTEGMSYRTAAILVLAGFLFFCIWGQMTGLGATNALVFFGFLVICGLSTSRIRTECGAPMTYFTPYMPYLIFYLIGGLEVFSVETMLLCYAAGGFMAVAQFLMFAPSQVEMLHLADTEKVSAKGVSWALVFGALGGIFIGGYTLMVWCYGAGGDNIPVMQRWGLGQAWYFNGLSHAVRSMDRAQEALASGNVIDQGPSMVGPWIATGVGAFIVLLLTVLRTMFVGFWLHPIGYILGNTYFIYMCWGSLFVAWVIKWLGLKIGGPRTVRDQMTPFFGGIFVGACIGMILWDILGIVLMSQGWTKVYAGFP